MRPEKVKNKNLMIFLHTIGPAGLTVLLFIFLSYIVAIPFIKQNLTEDRKRLIREVTHCALSVLSDYEKKVKRGEISPGRARQMAISHVKKIRYGPEGKDYLWINDMHPKMIMHPYRTDLDGRDISNFRDPKGKRLFVEMVSVVKEKNEGYVSYMWQWKDNPNLIVPKISYVKGFKPWGWIIGTGMYVEDVAANITRITRKINIIFIIVLILIIIISTYIIRHGVKTELQRTVAERDVKESQRSLRDIIQFLPDAVLVLNRNAEIIAWNRAMEELTGVPENEIIGKGDFEYAVPFYGEKRQILANIILASDASIPETYQIIERDENRIVAEAYTPGLPQGGKYLEATVGLLYNEKKKVTGAIEIIKDITQRKKADRELKDAQQYIHNIIDSMPSTLISIDSLGIINQANRAGEILIGISSSEASGKKISEIIPHIISDETLLRQAIDNRKIVEDRKIPWNTGDKIQYYHMTIFPLISNTRDGAVVRIDDITERVNLEEMMIQSEKMLSVGGLAAGMAHEINNPLAGIMGNIELAKNRLTQDNTANKNALSESGITRKSLDTYLERRKILKMLDMAHEGGKRAAEIVKNMLSFARKGEREIAPVYLPDLIDKTINLISTDYDLKKKYDFRHFHIERQYGENIPHVLCEESKIQQVLVNLIKNGAEAMNEFTENETAPAFSIRVHPEGNMVRIDIGDSGPGMSEEVRRRIFEPFFTTKGIGRGTGLGLSVSYFIITEDHHGEMTVESTPGKGTTFTIKLPAK